MLIDISGTSFKFNCKGIAKHQCCKPRQLRGAERLKEVALNYSTPSERRSELINKLGVYSSRVPTTEAITKARSELRCQLRGSSDWLIELRCLHASMTPSFIRSLEIIPFKLILWSELMLECFRVRTEIFGRSELYMDATGGKLNCIENKAVLTVSLVIAGVPQGSREAKTEPVALMITNSADTTCYTNFLQRWWFAVNSAKIISKPSAIVVDKNWPSIHSCCLVFNGLDIVQYLRKCKDVLDGKVDEIGIQHLTIIALARAHTVKNIVSLASIKNKDHLKQLWWKNAVVHLVTITSWQHLMAYIRSLLKVLLRSRSDSVEEDLYNITTSIIKSDMEVLTETEFADDDSSPTITHQSLYSQSPFYSLFHDIYEEIMLEEGNNTEITNTKQNAQLATDLIRTFIPDLPMISGVMYRPQRYAKGHKIDFGPIDDYLGWRESYVEGWHVILKNNILRHYETIKPHEFVQIVDKSLRGRCCDFIHSVIKKGLKNSIK